MVIRGIDIASHQGPNFPFQRARDEGYEFAIIKASGGHTYQNEHLANQVAGAREAGVLVGFYHYLFEPTSGGGDIDRELANFVAAVRPHVQPGATFWLDVEEFPQAVGFTGDLGAAIVAFCEGVEAEFGCVCGIYCATWYLVPTGLGTDQRLTKYPFWMASWQDAPPAPPFMAPWDHLTLWQYDAFDTVAGRKPIDEDLFQGTREEFLALGVGGAPPVPVPEPETSPAVPESVRSYLNGKGQLIVEINYGGTAVAVEGVNVVDVGGSVRNAAGEIFDRSVKANAFEPWQKRDAQATQQPVGGIAVVE